MPVLSKNCLECSYSTNVHTRMSIMCDSVIVYYLQERLCVIVAIASFAFNVELVDRSGKVCKWTVDYSAGGT